MGARGELQGVVSCCCLSSVLKAKSQKRIMGFNLRAISPAGGGGRPGCGLAIVLKAKYKKWFLGFNLIAISPAPPPPPPVSFLTSA